MRQKTISSLVLAAAMFVAAPTQAQEEGVARYAPGASTSGAAVAWAQVDATYDRATEALDEGNYDEAIDLYREVVAGGGERADAALYWIAYAEVRQGERASAMRTIGILRQEYPDSAWLDDAEYLEAEVRGASGQVEVVEDNDREEMRLYALNALMHAEPERAVPILERLIRSDDSIEVRKRALFILLQGHGEEAFDLVAEVARDDSDQEMRMHALQHLGMYGGERSIALLDEIYASTTDNEVRQRVLSGYMMGGRNDRLLEIARTETDTEIRIHAIRYLAMSGGTDELWSLYEAEESIEAREAILQTMFMSGDFSRLLQVARTEPELRLRKAAIQGLAMRGHRDDDDAETAAEQDEISAALLQLYRDNNDEEIRSSLLNAMWMRGEVGTLISLYEETQDPDTRRRIVQALSMADSEEAVEFLIRIIEQ